MARALAAALAASLLVAVSGAAGSGAQTPARGGTVVFGVVAEPTCLNVLLELCGGFTSFWITEEVLPGAFTLAPDFTLRPRLVSDVDVTKEPPFTLTYHIRPEASWSDGRPVSARDFVFTHKAIRTLLEPNSPDPHFQVRSIRALGPKTVRVVLRSRVGGWRNLFARVLPQHALAGEDVSRIWADGIENPKTGEPIGSGPFLVERWVRSSQLTLVRNPRYWGPHVAHLDRILLRFCEGCDPTPGSKVLEVLRSGQAHIALNRDTGIVSDLRRIPGIRVSSTPSTGWEHLALRVGPGGHPALKNKLVRRALAYGIDREALVHELFGELDPKYRPRDSAVFPNTSSRYLPTWGGYRYRPTLARRLLGQAGCRLAADGIYMCAGERLSLRVFTIAGSALRQRGVEILQSQLRTVGVQVVPTYFPGVPFLDQILPSGDFDAASFAQFVSLEDLGPKSSFGCGGDQNYTGYCQRLVTSDLEQAERILDTGKRARVLHRADRRLASDVPAIPLYQIPFVLAHRQVLRGVIATPFNPLWSAEDWWLAR